MQRNPLAFVIVALVAGFIGGFWLANSINRSAQSSIGTGTVPSQIANTTGVQMSSTTELSPDEIRSKIAEADQNPNNFSFQKSLGIGLYRYGAMTQDISVLGESARILTRASGLDGRDFDVLVALGNAHFDIGYANKERASFEKSREIYNKALVVKPSDPDVRTDIGISYYLQEPPDCAKAAAELEKVAAANPNHDRSMQFLVQVYLKQNRIADAEKMLSKIKEINPQNRAVADLSSRIEAAKGGAR